MIKPPQIIVLDAGGQYCHLIARKVRDLGVYSEVRPSDTPAAELVGAKGLIISGGPNSVYDPASPTVDPAIFQSGARVLGICYGQQLMAHLLGGTVQLMADKGEYGLATLDLLTGDAGSHSTLFNGITGRQQIWMSHRDLVVAAPPGFSVLASTATCAIAAIEAPERGLYAVQFHPEVAHTTRGREILRNFLFNILRLRARLGSAASRPADRKRDSPDRYSGDRNVFFFVSGGVDSTVACALCQRALGDGRVRALYVDTGLMREGETDYVRGLPGLSVESGRGAVSGRPGLHVRDSLNNKNAISSAKSSSGVQERIIDALATCSTVIGSSAKAPSIRIPSSPAAARKPPSLRRITTACPASSA